MEEKRLRILAVDDDGDILDLLKYNLEKAGFRVKTLRDSNRTIRVARTFEPDLIILDMMMPATDGLVVCRKLRAMKRFQDTYIFFLTARSERYYQYEAFGTGADDYVQKVTGLRSLTHKINAVLKEGFIIRKRFDEVHAGGLSIERKTNSVFAGGRRILLSQPEFELLFFLMQNAGRFISGDTLVHNLWGSELFLFESSFPVHIQSLQKKLGNHYLRKKPGDLYQLVTC